MLYRRISYDATDIVRTAAKKQTRNALPMTSQTLSVRRQTLSVRRQKTKAKQKQSRNALSMYEHSLLLNDCCLDGD